MGEADSDVVDSDVVCGRLRADVSACVLRCWGRCQVRDGGRGWWQWLVTMVGVGVGEMVMIARETRMPGARNTHTLTHSHTHHSLKRCRHQSIKFHVLAQIPSSYDLQSLSFPSVYHNPVTHPLRTTILSLSEQWNGHRRLPVRPKMDLIGDWLLIQVKGHVRL